MVLIFDFVYRLEAEDPESSIVDFSIVENFFRLMLFISILDLFDYRLLKFLLLKFFSLLSFN